MNRHGIWHLAWTFVEGILGEIGFSEAIRPASNIGKEGPTKHMGVKLTFSRQFVERGLIDLVDWGLYFREFN